MKLNHNYYSKLAFNLAEDNLGKTKNNPSVGCVVVKNNSVISSGVTSINGRPHAEFNALNRNINFNESSMYVTLEPCTHYGLTPPCTNIIKKKKIKNVYYTFNDPDKRTNKKAKKVLKKITKLNNIGIEHLNFYKSYFINQNQKLPLIDAKIAISKDFYTINKNNKWITNSRSRQIAHLIRSKYDCVVSTSESINKDNSLLNCRIKGLDNNKPDLIIIDRNLRIKSDLKLFKIAKKRKTYLFTISKDRKKISYLKKKNIKVIRINKLESKDDFKGLFKKIFNIGKGRVLIESGLVFLNKLLMYKFVNELYIFKSKVFLKNKGYNKTNIKFIKKLKFNNQINVNLNNDKLFRIRINHV
tara:strand:+ start:444 stop:1514 length:1071 start_codon:yes stop_codon:yes gene_type:complete